jgi:nitrite reductase (NADH) small subunit
MGEWIDVGALADIPLRGARTIPVTGGESIALFRTGDDQLFGLIDRCPHKHGPLSQGIIHGHAVACPLHNWRISLATGEALGEDKGCTPTVAVRVEGERVLVAAMALRARAA